MKRVLVVIAMLVVASISGILNYNYNENYQNRYDYFTNIKWEYTSNNQKEYIYFSSIGEFENYYDNGKVVRETADCSKYKYNEENNIITVLCYDNNIEINLVAYDENKLVLNFNGTVKEYKNVK